MRSDKAHQEEVVSGMLLEGPIIEIVGFSEASEVETSGITWKE